MVRPRSGREHSRGTTKASSTTMPDRPAGSAAARRAADQYLGIAPVVPKVPVGPTEAEVAREAAADGVRLILFATIALSEFRGRAAALIQKHVRGRQFRVVFGRWQWGVVIIQSEVRHWQGRLYTERLRRRAEAKVLREKERARRAVVQKEADAATREVKLRALTKLRSKIEHRRQARAPCPCALLAVASAARSFLLLGGGDGELTAVCSLPWAGDGRRPPCGRGADHPGLRPGDRAADPGPGQARR